jgi:hypothetical protein
MDSQLRIKLSATSVEVCVPSEERVVVGTYHLLSIAGVFVSTHEGVNAGTEVIVQLVLPGGMIRAEGLVVPTTRPENMPGFTIVFEEVLPLDRARIAAATAA